MYIYIYVYVYIYIYVYICMYSTYMYNMYIYIYITCDQTWKIGSQFAWWDLKVLKSRTWLTSHLVGEHIPIFAGQLNGPKIQFSVVKFLVFATNSWFFDGDIPIFRGENHHFSWWKPHILLGQLPIFLPGCRGPHLPPRASGAAELFGAWSASSTRPIILGDFIQRSGGEMGKCTIHKWKMVILFGDLMEHEDFIWWFDGKWWFYLVIWWKVRISPSTSDGKIGGNSPSTSAMRIWPL